MDLGNVAKPTEEIRALTSLRGIAALTVVLQHFSATAQTDCAGWMPSIVPHGYMAVDFFFVLSGFIMAYTYLPSFEAEGLKAYVPFLLKRVARIFPLGLAVLVIILALGAIASIWSKSDLFLNGRAVDAGLITSVIINVLHLQGFCNIYNLNDPSWSVSMELAAYVLFPVLLLVFFRAPFVVAAICLLGGTTVLVSTALATSRLSLAIRSVPFDITRCLTEFSYGLLTYRCFICKRRLAVLGTDLGTWSITAVSVAFLFLRLDLLVMFTFPFLVLAWSWNHHRARDVLSSEIPYYLGQISFSIYLVHHLFRRPELALLKHFAGRPVTPLEGLAFAFAGSLSVIPFAALTYTQIERRGRRAVNALVAAYVRSTPRAEGVPTASPSQRLVS